MHQPSSPAEAVTPATAAPMVTIWDLPTRIFHWLLVLAFAIAFASSDGDALLPLHLWAGSLFLVLLLFRLFWGFFGTRHARFADFAYSPARIWDYLLGVLRRSPSRFLGHNPPGGLAIFLLLGLGILLSLSGMMVFGGEEGRGPFAGLLSFGAGRAAKEVHELLFALMATLVGVHLAGVLVESVLHRENLVGAMFHGRKRPLASGEPPATIPTRPVVALLLVIGAVAIPAALVLPLGTAPLWATAPAVALDVAWRTECGDCHMAFHPSLLPSRSWEAMLQGGDDHFGEVLSLSPETREELRQAFAGRAAEAEWTEAAFKINRSLKGGATPLRISDTPYWIRKHREIGKETWKNPETAKSRCEKCHADAEGGIFDDGAVTWHSPIRKH
ncbi:MAG: cytochrome b/b6 domain-containing protein [Magnetococcales bacterium]|nr:cytochrome b/b6 domain-containing protein [Magnetococcales bacterium]